MPSYGIVFSGGGALGAWEVGCYSAIRSWHKGADPVVVTGASAGALNAVGVCAGMAAQHLQDLWAGIGPGDVYTSRFGTWRRTTLIGRVLLVGLPNTLMEVLSTDQSIFDTSPLVATLRAKLKGHFQNFRQSQIHFAVSVTNLTHNRREFFYKRPPGAAQVSGSQSAHWTPVDGLDLLIDALVGSTALPILFPPWKGYFDGGVLLNQPITPAMHLQEPEVLYVVIPSAQALGGTASILEIGSTTLTAWLTMSLVTQIERIKLINKIRGFTGDRKMVLCVVRPDQDLTRRFGVDLLSFGTSVNEMVQDGYVSAQQRLNLLDLGNENTWY